MSQITKKIIYLAGGILLLLTLYAFLYKVYMPRVNAFGCFDDCNNFMGGYFLLHGKKLFSEIFFNHNLGMAYLSAFIQAFTHPQNLYDLILKHRQFVFFFGLLMNVVLFLRFGYKVLGFTLVFEFTKFYLFGDRFLAEGIIVYPLVYMAGIGWEKLQKHHVLVYDFVLAGIFGWFVVWMREPYIPLALLLLGIILWGRDNWKQKGIGLGLFTVFSLLTLFYHNIPELIFNVFTVNAVVNIPLENKASNILGTGLLTSFLYPAYVFLWGQQTFLHVIEILLALFFFAASIDALVKRKFRLLLFVFITLGVANLRYTTPGKEYYEAFHQIVWYGLFIFFTTSLIIRTQIKWLKIVTRVGFVGVIVYILLSPSSFWHEKGSPYEEFITNYGKVLQAGEIVATLSKPRDILFVDGYDDMVYWVSKRYSSYQYSWYTSLMPVFPKYTNARDKMLTTNPPDFYYGSCLTQDTPKRILTSAQQAFYTRLLNSGKPSCLWVKTTKLQNISQAQWEEAKKGYYSLPDTTPNEVQLYN